MQNCKFHTVVQLRHSEKAKKLEKKSPTCFEFDVAEYVLKYLMWLACQKKSYLTCVEVGNSELLPQLSLSSVVCLSFVLPH